MKARHAADAILTADEFGFELSDELCKEIHESVDEIELLSELYKMDPSNKDILEWALKRAPKYNDNYDFDRDGHMWRDDVLEGYANHIHNYYYNYKPEATDIDPNIDPNEEHIGPMAQDIEKVNPAAIKETSEGVKTVDTGRLALMNAGAIAELARQVRELQNG